MNLSKAGQIQENMDLLSCHRDILSTLIVHGRHIKCPPGCHTPDGRKWAVVYKNEVRCKYSTQISGRKMLFLRHFVVNWSEQLTVMQLMELLLSFHLQCPCLCVSKQRKAWLDVGEQSFNTGANTER